MELGLERALSVGGEPGRMASIAMRPGFILAGLLRLQRAGGLETLLVLHELEGQHELQRSLVIPEV